MLTFEVKRGKVSSEVETSLFFWIVYSFSFKRNKKLSEVAQGERGGSISKRKAQKLGISSGKNL